MASIKFVFLATSVISIFGAAGVLMAFIGSVSNSVSQQISVIANDWAVAFVILAIILFVVALLARR